MSFDFLNQIVIFSIDLIGFCLAFWVLFANWKNKINKYFSLMVISYLFWISFYYIMRLPGQADHAFIWAKLGFSGVFIFAKSKMVGIMSKELTGLSIFSDIDSGKMIINGTWVFTS